VGQLGQWRFPLAQDQKLDNSKMSNTVAMCRQNFECLVGVCTYLYKNRELSCGCCTNCGDFRHRCQIVIIILGDGPFLVTPISDGMAGDPTLFCQQGPTCDMLMGGPLPGTW
jgi:hypothetical protein